MRALANIVLFIPLCLFIFVAISGFAIAFSAYAICEEIQRLQDKL